MSKKRLVEIKVIDGERPNTKIFIMSQNIKGLSLYESSKAIDTFINRETNVLQTCISNYIRQVLISHSIIPQDGSESALNRAFNDFKYKYGKEFDITNRYIDTKETIVGEKDEMTVINEDGILSRAIEIEMIENG